MEAIICARFSLQSEVAHEILIESMTSLVHVVKRELRLTVEPVFVVVVKDFRVGELLHASDCCSSSNHPQSESSFERDRAARRRIEYEEVRVEPLNRARYHVTLKS